jgi:hypothetical protein
VRPGKPYPATFRFSGPTGNRTRISSMPNWCLPVGPWAHWRPVDRMGVEPTTPTLQGSVAPTEHASPSHERSVRESNPVPLLTTEVCCRNTYRPGEKDEGGRMNDELVSSSVSCIHPSAFILHPFPSDRGRSRTCKITRTSASPLCHFAHPVVASPGVAPGKRSSWGSAEHWPTRVQVAGPGIEPGTPAL